MSEKIKVHQLRTIMSGLLAGKEIVTFGDTFETVVIPELTDKTQIVSGRASDRYIGRGGGIHLINSSGAKL